MVCDRVGYRSTVQMLYFVGFMCGAIFFGTMADKYIYIFKTISFFYLTYIFIDLVVDQ